MIYDDDRIIEEQANNTANRVKRFFFLFVADANL